MSKKKGKTVKMPSPQRYIRTRARSLPLGKCYMLPDWESSGMTPVLVSRVHVTGQLTFASYLVDLLCLGIKDTFFDFNADPDDLQDIVRRGGLTEVDYTTAHNVVYGAVDYAEEFGFKPHREWADTQYILEADTEAIPLMEVEFGEDGIPVYVAGPYDDPKMINRVLSTLERTAGSGNFKFYRGENLVDKSLLDDDDWEEEDDVDDNYSHEELFAPGEIERIMKGAQEPNLKQRFSLGATLYFQYFGRNDEVWAKVQDRLDEDTQNLLDADLRFISDPEIQRHFDRIEVTHGDFLTDIETIDLEELKRRGQAEPEHPCYPFWEYLAYRVRTMYQESQKVAEGLLASFPDFLNFRFMRACDLGLEDRTEEAGALLRAPYLSEACSGHSAVSLHEYILFHAAWCVYYTNKGLLERAIQYGRIILADVDDNTLAELVIHKLIHALDQEIVEK